MWKLSMAKKNETPSTGKQQFNVYLPPDLVKQMKHHAIEEGEFMSRLVEKIFRSYLATHEEKRK